MAQPTVTAVVVTRDRRELLHACLTALGAQTRAVDRILVVDNFSSDGTPDMVRAEFPHVDLLCLTENVGGAGGFHAGMREASDAGADWLWILDDDTIAQPTALERLLDAPWREAGLPEPSLLASRVNWTDGEPHPMNMPILRRRDPEGLVAAAGVGLLPLRSATFVSSLVSGDAVRRHGLPLAEYFLQADDVEFTARVLRREHGYFVPDSIVEHRTKSPHNFLSDAFRFYYHLRNTLFMLRSEAWAPNEKAALRWVLLESSTRFLWLNRFNRESAATVVRALRDGLSRRVVA